MRPLLVRAVSIDGILENMGRMRSLAAETHRKITRRYHGVICDLRGWREIEGAAQRVFPMPEGPRGHRRQAGAEP